MSKMVEGTECFYREFTCACGCVECRREARKGRGVKWECEVEVVPNCNEGVDSVGLTWCPFGSRGARDDAALRRASASLSLSDQSSP